MSAPSAIKYVYHRMFDGKSLSYGYIAPADKASGGTVQVAFLFGSSKDEFSRKTAKHGIAAIPATVPHIAKITCPDGTVRERPVAGNPGRAGKPGINAKLGTNPILLTQRPGQHVLDVISDYINSPDFFRTMPPSWQAKHPGGFRQRKAVILVEVTDRWADRVMDQPITQLDTRVHRSDWVAATKFDTEGKVIKG